jgi:hypothetical protein
MDRSSLDAVRLRCVEINFSSLRAIAVLEGCDPHLVLIWGLLWVRPRTPLSKLAQYLLLVWDATEAEE